MKVAKSYRMTGFKIPNVVIPGGHQQTQNNNATVYGGPSQGGSGVGAGNAEVAVPANGGQVSRGGDGMKGSGSSGAPGAGSVSRGSSMQKGSGQLGGRDQMTRSMPVQGGSTPAKVGGTPSNPPKPYSGGNPKERRIK